MKGTKVSLFRFFLRWWGRFTFLRFGVRDRLIRLIHNPDKGSDEEFVVPFFGLYYKGSFNSFIDWSVFYYGAYCIQELHLIRDFLGCLKEPVFLDVGANVGHHTLFAAGISKQVISVEPYPAVRAKMETQINFNEIKNVKIVNYGLGENAAIIPYFPPDSTNTGTGSFINPDGARNALLLQIRTGDEMFEIEKIPMVSFIKIDTEGFERAVLRGMQRVLQENRPIVFLEWTQHETVPFHPDMGKALFPASYSYYQFVEGQVIWYFFQRPGYRLRPVTEEWKDGMILAVPDELMTQKSFFQLMQSKIIGV